jgi:hypothetical protein
MQRDSDSFVIMVTKGESLCWPRLASLSKVVGREP